ncbi:MAG: polysaccharide biosynthesis protein [Clostridiales Family XIII bacterium]|jgi:FlaA1/EpsC-like NDP-sugar epimerase|nr:polysaccharide biosynthesis protein [Clostridiales Family XIII bacterium]
MKKIGRIIALILVDAVIFNISYVLSYLIRFEFKMSSPTFLNYFSEYLKYFWLLTTIKVIVFFFFKMYRILWKYAGVSDLLRVAFATVTANALAISTLELLSTNMPRSIYIVSFTLDLLFIMFSKFIYRAFGSKGHRSALRDAISQIKKKSNYKEESIKRIMIVGAGDAGSSLLKEIKQNPDSGKKVVAMVDDDKIKKNTEILGVKVLGSTENIRQITRHFRIDEIYIAIPSANKKRISDILLEANKTEANVRILPSLMELVDNKVSVKALRDINLEDLLGRDEVEINIREVSSYLEGKIILVTGGGGSIGSQIAREVIKFRPRKLILLDVYENNIYSLQTSLREKYPDIELIIMIDSIVDRERMDEIFNEYNPHIVFHAAAHKHVPLMETNPKDALKNNVLGTKNLIDMADRYRVEKFIMISTDKAVYPTSVMGATKRLAEIITFEKNKTSVTAFSIVRFGNVLGSNGSVIPIFQKQIEDGGPLTVTDPDIKRYFMTIPEASLLVLQAGAMTEGGEIFILNMGKQIKIIDLAESVIKLSGLEPYKDIDIKITGLRQGEKMEETLIYNYEETINSIHDKIMKTDNTKVIENLERALAGRGDTFTKVIADYVVVKLSNNEIKAWIKKVIPEYTPDYGE